MRFLRRHNVRGFVALNTLIFSDELPAVADCLRSIADAGVDAVIVQDLGLVDLIRRLVPTLAVHASTQMTLTEPRGIAFVRRLGVDRVVLARELSLADIGKVTAATDTPVEVFVHGALCVAYSGQCLTSEALGGRSANRGQCAQACRLPYEMIVDGKRRDLGDRAYLLSPQDLAAYEVIPDLIAAGVASFKIEGRLKGGPYVSATCQAYRKAIDATLERRELTFDRRDELDLAQTFSRGLTHGFLDGVNHQALVRGRFPKSRGVRVGTVAGFDHRTVLIAPAETVDALIKPGDGLLFDLGTPEVDEPGGRVWSADYLSDRDRWAVGFADSAVDISKIPIGCDVWKTDDPALRKRLEQTYSQDRPARRRRLDAAISGAVGSPLRLTVRDTDGRSAEAVWAGPLERARTRPTAAADIRDQLGRLGDTPFELGSVEFAVDGSAIVPRSVVNDLRRRAVQTLLAEKHHAVASGDVLADLRSNAVSCEPPGPADSARLTVTVRTLEQLDTVVGWAPPAGLPAPAMVYCDFEDLRQYAAAVDRTRSAGMPVGLATLRVLKPGEDAFHRLIVRANPDAVLVRTLGSIDYFREQLPGANLVGDFSLNVANELSAAVVRRAGIARQVPSFDLSWDQFEAMLSRSDPAWFEPVIHQHMPMFHMEHCVFAAFLSDGKDHRDCGRPCDRHRVELKDRVGAAFPVHPDTGCRNTVYNSVPQSAAEYVDRMRQCGVRTFRVDLLRESPSEIGGLLDQYAGVVAGRDDGRGTWRRLRAVNRLGLTRGTLQMTS